MHHADHHAARHAGQRGGQHRFHGPEKRRKKPSYKHPGDHAEDHAGDHPEQDKPIPRHNQKNQPASGGARRNAGQQVAKDEIDSPLHAFRASSGITDRCRPCRDI